MLFNLKVSEVKSIIESNTSEVEGLLSRVEDLQEENKKLKDYLQQLGVASKASESALEELKKAYLMLKKVDPSQMDVLKQEVDRLYLRIKKSEIKSAGNSQNIPSSSSQLKVENDGKIKNNKTELINQNSQNNVNVNYHKKDSSLNQDDTKAVDVEVLKPEENLSNFEAVMKLKKLIK
jgi:hypothetical protein